MSTRTNAEDSSAAPRLEDHGSWWRFVPARTTISSARVAVDSTGCLPFNALLAFTALVVLAPQSSFPALQPLRLPFVVGGLAMGSYLIHSLLHGLPLTVRVQELKLLAGILLWAVITVPFSLHPGGSVEFILDSYSKSLVIFFLIVNLVVTPARLRRMAWLLTLVSIPLAGVALANFHAGVYLQGAINQRVVGYQAALTQNPNDLALLLNVILPLSGGLLRGERRRAARAVLILVMLSDVAAIVVTFSRGGFLTLTATTAIFLWRIVRRRKAPWAAFVAVAALACVPLLPGGYLQRIGTSVDMDSDPTGSSQARWRLAQGAVVYLVKHPLVGSGIGTGGLALNEQIGPTWQQVHNTYLEYGLELGLPGLVLFVLLTRSALNGARLTERHLRARRAPGALLALHDGVQLSLIAFIVGALFSPGAYGWVTHYAIGMAVASRIAFATWVGSATVRRDHE
jgi:O-antigen ligase